MGYLDKLFLPFVVMSVLIVLSNLLVQYPFEPFGIVVFAQWATWGTLIYPFTFLVNDLTNRFYGTRVATRLVLVSFPVGVLISVFAASWRIALASGIAFLVAQQLDNKVFHHLRDRIWWHAPFLSSVLATFVDSWIFYAGAFWGATGEADYFGYQAPLWVGWTIGDLLFKLMVAVILLVPYRFFLRLPVRP